ncbi:hypothetical protein GE061_004361 [Apolygus lucorum]|uniref:Uncharacterized protein n=1 Tax=Apolygus lucorum TaxID=248454 RepID=A0A6A4J4Y5_APOLU|nr:hypothetical protein GE061_004361 [Apolygus lucorum]
MMDMWLSISWAQLTMIIVIQTAIGEIILDRNPRYLPFPRGIGNKLQVITGFGIPVPDIKDDVTYGLIIKSNYALPTNSSEFTQPELAYAGFSRVQPGAQISRVTWYNLLKGAMERLQIRGDSCLPLTICQASFTIFEQQGLLGEIMKVMFLPSTTPGEDLLVPNEYKIAEEIGEKAEEESECRRAYPSCEKSIIDMITTLEENKVVKMMLDFL